VDVLEGTAPLLPRSDDVLEQKSRSHDGWAQGLEAALLHKGGEDGGAANRFIESAGEP
jgi:hypothetical protein